MKSSCARTISSVLLLLAIPGGVPPLFAEAIDPAAAPPSGETVPAEPAAAPSGLVVTTPKLVYVLRR